MAIQNLARESLSGGALFLEPLVQGLSTQGTSESGFFKGRKYLETAVVRDFRSKSVPISLEVRGWRQND